MLFTLQGFSHRNTVRVYQFLRVDAAFVRTRFTVDVDLRSMAEFHIPVQEAPLMCRHLLENLPEGDALRQLALTTENMRTYADERAAVQSRSAKNRTNRYHARPQVNPPEGQDIALQIPKA